MLILSQAVVAVNTLYYFIYITQLMFSLYNTNDVLAQGIVTGIWVSGSQFR